MRPRVSVRRNVTSILKRFDFCVHFVFSVAILRSGSYFICKCNVSKVLALAVTLKFDMLPSARCVHTLCNPRLQWVLRATMTFSENNRAIEILR